MAAAIEEQATVRLELVQPEEKEEAEEEKKSDRSRDVRPRTIAVKRLTKEQLRIGRLLYPDTNHWRPSTRGECSEFCRPCLYVGCVHNLYLDVGPISGSIKLNFPDIEPEDMDPECSCVLDIAERGGLTLLEIGLAMNITRERIRQIEMRSLRKLREDQENRKLSEYY